MLTDWKVITFDSCEPPGASRCPIVDDTGLSELVLHLLRDQYIKVSSARPPELDPSLLPSGPPAAQIFPLFFAKPEVCNAEVVTDT
ncbi:BQ5605_C002g01380 [Microbotryum silenes-dioicae]|uniref:BQ5605_C002g01380 protein n=1 Tax=Microbotryum silenes-dioicae TaxID=796604 RepID=A0A2X0M325_9BASI|nr:BQ5605_C002g01380 [Microbotryum silenes-dioicae]